MNCDKCGKKLGQNFYRFEGKNYHRHCVYDILSENPEYILCPDCKGSGRNSGNKAYFATKCNRCNGYGWIKPDEANKELVKNIFNGRTERVIFKASRYVCPEGHQFGVQFEIDDYCGSCAERKDCKKQFYALLKLFE